MSRIYIETTIPSFYFETRTDPENAARRNWTRRWFDRTMPVHEIVTSTAVLDELKNGNFPSKGDAIEIITNLEQLAITGEILNIVEAYIERKMMPRDPTGDALHLAIASYHNCDFLVTWNCKHLANANKFGHINRVNDILGLKTPMLTTPLALLEGDDNA